MRAKRCPTCGSTDTEVLGDDCRIPEGIDDRHIPVDEFADDWHFPPEDDEHYKQEEKS